ncbi:MAG TPA: T9SS type A sorting domain-containing protein [Bacteroidota bacterium]|nr:T9SS type A sorting domain-containing protein [Bacteroidota bacterium]
MKYFILLLSLVLAVPTAEGQKRFLVSPTNDVIPLRKGESAREAVEKLTSGQRLREKSQTNSAQTDRFGYPPDLNPVDGTLLAFHKDVVAMWFVIPATGFIDSIFWQAGPDVGALDSTIYVQMLRSNINTQTGPGIPPYPPPGCVNWGYWLSTYDLDQGISPFIELATDPTWHSTLPGSTPSFPPIGDGIWLPYPGLAVRVHPNEVNSIAMSISGDPEPQLMNCGDAFFITMQVKGPFCCHVNDGPTTWTYSTVNAPSPSRVWKFYEHQSPAECQGTFHQGWTARSLVNNDTVVPFVLNWWYVMTLTGETEELACPSDVQVNSGPNACGALVDYETPTSRCGSVTCSPPSGSFFSVGTTQVLCESVSPLGDTTGCSFNVTVLDQQLPTLSVLLTPSQLWPPNHQLAQISATVSVSDNCPGVSYVLLSVTSNEQDNGLGDGDLANDIQGAAIGTADNTFFLRAERAAPGSGRIYTVTYIATDASGNTSSERSGTVRVPLTLRSIAGSGSDLIGSDNARLDFRLSESYPNPFNPTTELRFDIPEKSYVWLKVFDALGREVATLVDEQLQPGAYARTFDARELTSGIYVYRLTVQAAGQTLIDTRKMVLMK